jgi:hypothetical protein
MMYFIVYPDIYDSSFCQGINWFVSHIEISIVRHEICIIWFDMSQKKVLQTYWIVGIISIQKSDTCIVSQVFTILKERIRVVIPFLRHRDSISRVKPTRWKNPKSPKPTRQEPTSSRESPKLSDEEWIRA